ncbi:MAG: flagellar hook-length control protein FliK [Vicinamibacterales bacterium]
MIALGVQFPAAVAAAFPAAAAPADDPELFTDAAAFVGMLQQLTAHLAPEGAATAAVGAGATAASFNLSDESGEAADVNPGAITIVADWVRPPDLVLSNPAAVAGSPHRDTDVPISSESAPRDNGDDADPGNATSVFPVGMLQQIAGVAIPIVPGPGAPFSERRPVDGPAGAPEAFPISLRRGSSVVSTASEWEAAVLDEAQAGIPPQASGRAIQDQAARVSTAVPTPVPSGVPTAAFVDAAQVTPAMSPEHTMAGSVASGLIEPDPAAAPARGADVLAAVPTGETLVLGRTKSGNRASQPAQAENRSEDERRLPADGRPGINADRVGPVMPASKQDPGSGESPQRWPSGTPAREHASAPTVLSVTTESRLSMPAVPPTAATSAVADPVAETELPRQIVHSIRLQAMAGGGEAHVRLRPEYLGELTVAVKVERGAVTATLHAETPAVRQWIEANEASLRQGLAEHGLHLDKLTILDEAPQPESAPQDRRERGREEQARQEQSRRQAPRRPRPEAGTATFEVVV